MIGAVHACIGAGVGSFFKRKSAAFAAGVVSHFVADALPHKDYDPKIEAPLLVGALAVIAAWRGVDSPEFCGAVGGMLPDVEHGLSVAGVIDDQQKIFPTHIDSLPLHGPESNERWSQLIVAGVALLTVALNTESRE